MTLIKLVQISILKINKYKKNKKTLSGKYYKHNNFDNKFHTN